MVFQYAYYLIYIEINLDKKINMKNKFLSTICQNQVKKIMEI